MTTLGRNISALKAQRQLETSSGKLSNVFERLSSGQRINKAADDAAGLAISESLKSNSRVYSRAILNAGDAISALSIAEGAVDQLSQIVQRQIELAEQSANGVYSDKQRRALHSEAFALTEEYNRIVESTTFNNRDLLENPDTGMRVQLGYGVDGSIAFSLGNEMDRTVGTGGFSADMSVATANNIYQIQTADLNGDGFMDYVSATAGANISVGFGSANGPTSSYLITNINAITSNPISSIKVADLNGDGINDIVIAGSSDKFVTMLGKGDGTFLTPVSTDFGSTGIAGVTDINIGDLNNDGKADVVVSNYNAQTAVSFGNGDGTFGNTISFAGAHTSHAAIGDFDGDGDNDVMIGYRFGGGIWVQRNDGNGIFTATPAGLGSGVISLDAGDIDQDGDADFVFSDFYGGGTYVALSKGNNTFDVRQLSNTLTDVKISDFNNDGYHDIISFNGGTDVMSVYTQNKSGTFNEAVTTAVQSIVEHGYAIGDINGDSVNDILFSHPTADTTLRYKLGSTTTSNKQQRYSMLSREESLATLDSLRTNLTRLSNEKGAIGAVQQRLGFATENLRTARENFEAANSRIVDADIASESADLVRTTILQQAASAVMAQANQQPQIALRLLQI